MESDCELVGTLTISRYTRVCIRYMREYIRYVVVAVLVFQGE